MAPSATAAAQPLNFAIQTTDSSGTLMTLRSTTNAMESHLNQLVQAFQDAINYRNLSLDAPIWRHLHTTYDMTDFRITPVKKTPPKSLTEKFKEVARVCEQSRLSYVFLFARYRSR